MYIFIQKSKNHYIKSHFYIQSELEPNSPICLFTCDENQKGAGTDKNSKTINDMKLLDFGSYNAFKPFSFDIQSKLVNNT